MLVAFSKANGVPVLTCVRDDGTSTYAKSEHGAFFGPHDLMHYAVETTLGLRESFFGLIERGRSIASFSESGTAAMLPPEATQTEMIVGQLMPEQQYGPTLDAEEFNRVLAASLAGVRPVRGGPPATEPPRLSDEQLQRIRKLHDELLERYRGLRKGERLELRFPAS